MGGVPVELIGDGRIATTDERGPRRLDLGDGGVLGLWATTGDDDVVPPVGLVAGLGKPSEQSDEGRWYVFDDRGIYKPGETVRITGWVRRFAWSEDAQLALYGDDVSVSYRASDPQGNEIGAGSVDLNALGGFNLSLVLPDGANLGEAWVELTLDGLSGGYASTGHTFQIQEFRTPEFEVTARTESSAPFYVVRPATVAVDAEYFAGGPLPDAEVNWLVSTRDDDLRPAELGRVHVRRSGQPWWYFGGFAEDVAYAGDVAYESDVVLRLRTRFRGHDRYEEFTGRTDAGGTHYLQIDFDGPDVDLPTAVTAEATVFDVNRQAWSSRTDRARPRSPVLRRACAATVRSSNRAPRSAIDADRHRRRRHRRRRPGGRRHRRPSRMGGTSSGQWTEQLVDEQTCTITSSWRTTSDGSMRCEFDTEVGGTYRITAIVIDDDGHRNRTELTQWVSGGDGASDPERRPGARSRSCPTARPTPPATPPSCSSRRRSLRRTGSSP